MCKFYTIPDFANMMRISKASAYRIIKEEKLNLLSLGPRSKRISETQIIQLVKKYGGEYISMPNSEMLAEPIESEDYCV